MKIAMPVTAVLVLLGLAPATSQADFFFFLGNPPGYNAQLSTLGYTESNVQFNTPGLTETGTTVQGFGAGQIQDFTSTETLAVTAQGTAKITAVDGDFNELTIRPDTIYTYHSISLNLGLASGASGMLTVTVHRPDGSTMSQPIQLNDTNGQEFVGVIASGTDAISALELTSASSLPMNSVGQVGVTGVPEPSPLLLCGAVGAVLGASRALRRRSRPSSTRDHAARARCRR